jgi:hypothetical protein
MDLSPETEEVLRRARVGERMPAGHKRRLKGAVLARIAFASTATLAAGQATVSAMGLAAKTVVGIALVGSLGTGSYLALRSSPDHSPAHAERVARARPAVVAEVAPPAPVVVKVQTPTTISRGKRPVEHRVAVEEPSTLAQETTLLRDADRALRAGDTPTAIALLDQHAARFPKGALAPERAAERLIVFCQVGAGDPGAVTQFLAAHPGSPLAARVRRACGPQR